MAHPGSVGGRGSVVLAMKTLLYCAFSDPLLLFLGGRDLRDPPRNGTAYSEQEKPFKNKFILEVLILIHSPDGPLMAEVLKLRGRMQTVCC